MQFTFQILLFIIGFTVLIRLLELRIAMKNLKKRQMNSETHVVEENYYFLFFILHISFLFIVPLEIFFLERTFYYPLAIATSIVLLLALILRIHILYILKENWNVRVVYNLESKGIITKGVYQYIRHPNYLVVILEIASISMFHTAFFSCLVYSIANALLLSVRIRKEEECLFQNEFYKRHFENKKRFIPGVF